MRRRFTITLTTLIAMQMFIKVYFNVEMFSAGIAVQMPVSFVAFG